MKLKKKVMLAILAGGILCANGAFADVGKVWYAKTGGNEWTATDFADIFGSSTFPYVGNGTAVTDFCSTGANLTLNGGGSANGVSFNDASVYIAGYGYNPSAGSTVSGNTLTITGGNFTAKFIIAGAAEGENAENKVTGNTLEIKDGMYKTGYIIGGFCLGGVASNSVSGNTVKISGGTFGGEGYLMIAGGCSMGDATTSNNTVEITGGTFVSTVEIVGGMCIFGGGSSFGNILNLKTKMSGKVAAVAEFQTMNFTLPANIQARDTMLSTGYLVADDTATINVDAADGVKLKAGDVITLIQSDETYGTYVGGEVLGGAGEVSLDGYNLILTLLNDFGAGGGDDQQKAPVEAIAAGMAMIN